MSVIDEIKARLSKLEAGGDVGLAARVQAIEEVLGLKPEPHPMIRATDDSVLAAIAPYPTHHCNRCGNDQTEAGIIKCPQQKCPLK